ncbi:scavenger receptor class b type-1 sr-b1 [Holotrichia oblita]|uniref:Scavenger receptor class b type-1 sr-b1 n=1 Tax=Holotrichia oblita TaxID=644536 RepID=A0ACB9T9Q4_HOLOL|nr:scavenger receptor class b type-1 sr-b1 [Holotrichia oblita]
MRKTEVCDRPRSTAAAAIELVAYVLKALRPSPLTKGINLKNQQFLKTYLIFRFGAPAFVSYPHFYLADRYYTDPIVGMEPNPDKHEFFITLEPNTGIPLQVRAAVQLNLLIEPMKNIHMFKNVKETFVPMLWFSQTTELTKTLGRKTKILLIVPSILTYTGCGLIGIACLLIFVSVYYAYNKVWISNEEERLLSEDT